MDYPVIFPLRESLEHRSPDEVRRILRMGSFRQHPTEHTPYTNPQARGFSEIWHKLAGRGYAVVRIDSQGHANLADRHGNRYEIGGIASGVHGGVPHYHKEWIPAELLHRYLFGSVPQTVCYDDAGDPVTGVVNPLTGRMRDDKAKRVHIRQ
jgi:hypothetical protein